MASEAQGDYSHAEGFNSWAYGEGSHAEGAGFGSYANGLGSHAEGMSTADGDFSHAEGSGVAHGVQSHAEGNGIVYGYSSHAEGTSTAYGDYSHTEGVDSKTISESSHAEGEKTYAFGRGAHAEGYYEFTPTNWRLSTTDPKRKVWKAGSLGTATVGDFVEYNNSFFKIEAISNIDKTVTFSGSIPGTTTTNVAFRYYGKIGAYGNYSHTEGSASKAMGNFSHAEGEGSQAYGLGSHAQGYHSFAEGDYSHAEGINSWAYGEGSHAEGCDFGSYASGSGSHAEGMSTASGFVSHSEGTSTAEGDYSHAEGNASYAEGDCSHAEGWGSVAIGRHSHAEGSGSAASGEDSHAEGDATIASGKASHAQGMYNITDNSVTIENPKGTYAHIVGNGSSEENRSNAHAIDWNGNAYFSGDVYTGVTSDEYENVELLNGSNKKLATEKYVSDNYLNLNGGTIESTADSSELYRIAPLTIKGGELTSLIKFSTRKNKEGSIGIYGSNQWPVYKNSSGTIYDLGAYIYGQEIVAQNSPFNSMTWQYRKWLDGTIEIWGTYSMTITSDLWVEDKSQGINLGLVSLCPYRVNGHMVLKLPKDIEIAEDIFPRTEIATLQINEEGWRPITIIQRRTSDVTANTTLGYNFSTYFGNGTKDVPISINFYIRQ